jgi:hypothetical protein
MTGRSWTLIGAAVLAVLLPMRSEAQLGGLKKLKEKIVGGDKAAAAAAPTSPSSPYNEYVLELKADVTDCLERALAAENAELDAFRAWASRVKSRDAYQACQGQHMMTPEAQALAQEYTAAMQGNDSQASMRAMKVYAQKMEALTEKACGPKPESVDERRSEALKAASAKGQATCGYTDRQYFILKERIPPICASGQLGSADGALKLQGEGKDNFWVYSATEVEVLEARCAGLQGALQKQQ